MAISDPSAKYAKLHTAVAGNNSDHTLCSLHFCLFVPNTVHILQVFVFSTHPVCGASRMRRRGFRAASTASLPSSEANW